MASPKRRVLDRLPDVKEKPNGHLILELEPYTAVVLLKELNEILVRKPKSSRPWNREECRLRTIVLEIIKLWPLGAMYVAPVIVAGCFDVQNLVNGKVSKWSVPVKK